MELQSSLCSFYFILWVQDKTCLHNIIILCRQVTILCTHLIKLDCDKISPGGTFVTLYTQQNVWQTETDSKVSMS